MRSCVKKMILDLCMKPSFFYPCAVQTTKCSKAADAKEIFTTLSQECTGEIQSTDYIHQDRKHINSLLGCAAIELSSLGSCWNNFSANCVRLLWWCCAVVPLLCPAHAQYFPLKPRPLSLFLRDLPPHPHSSDSSKKGEVIQSYQTFLLLRAARFHKGG